MTTMAPLAPAPMQMSMVSDVGISDEIFRLRRLEMEMRQRADDEKRRADERAADVKRLADDLEGLQRKWGDTNAPAPVPAPPVRTARGTRRATTPVMEPAPVATPVAPAAPAAVLGELSHRIRDALTGEGTEYVLRPADLAKKLSVAKTEVEHTLTELERAGQIYRFDTGVVAWKVREVPAREAVARITKYLSDGRQLTTKNIREAFGSADRKFVHKLVNNYLPEIRQNNPFIHGTETKAYKAGKAYIYWISDREPPREFDVRLAKRARATRAGTAATAVPTATSVTRRRRRS